MRQKSYTSKWLLTYKGTVLASVYGKRKAYALYVGLSGCLLGLAVEPAIRKKRKTKEEIAEYNKRWREKNRDKIRSYNRKSYIKRKNRKGEGSIRMMEEDQPHDAPTDGEQPPARAADAESNTLERGQVSGT